MSSALTADRESRVLRNAAIQGGAYAIGLLRAGRRVQARDIASAEDFIEQVARRSGATVKRYRVCNPDGGVVAADGQLLRLLVTIAVARRRAPAASIVTKVAGPPRRASLPRARSR